MAASSLPPFLLFVQQRNLSSVLNILKHRNLDSCLGIFVASKTAPDIPDDAILPKKLLFSGTLKIWVPYSRAHNLFDSDGLFGSTIDLVRSFHQVSCIVYAETAVDFQKLTNNLERQMGKHPAFEVMRPSTLYERGKLMFSTALQRQHLPMPNAYICLSNEEPAEQVYLLNIINPIQEDIQISFGSEPIIFTWCPSDQKWQRQSSASSSASLSLLKDCVLEFMQHLDLLILKLILDRQHFPLPSVTCVCVNFAKAQFGFQFDLELVATMTLHSISKIFVQSPPTGDLSEYLMHHSIDREYLLSKIQEELFRLDETTKLFEQFDLFYRLFQVGRSSALRSAEVDLHSLLEDFHCDDDNESRIRDLLIIFQKALPAFFRPSSNEPRNKRYRSSSSDCPRWPSGFQPELQQLSVGQTICWKATSSSGTLFVKMPTDSNRRQFQREYEMLQMLEEKNVDGVLRLCPESLPDRQIVLPFMVSLADIQAERGAFSTEEADQITQKVMAILKKCHQEGIFHRDIRPSTILIGTDKKEPVVDWRLFLVNLEFQQDYQQGPDRPLEKTIDGRVNTMIVLPELNSHHHQRRYPQSEVAQLCALFIFLQSQQLIHCTPWEDHIQARFQQFCHIRNLLKVLRRGLSQDFTTRFPTIEALETAWLADETLSASSTGPQELSGETALQDPQGHYSKTVDS